MSKKPIIKAFICFFILNILIFTLHNPVIAKSKGPIDPKVLSEFLDDFFLKKMSEHHVPGAAIVIIKDDKIIFSKGYGYANIEEEVPINPKETVFRVASVSKVFTITGIMQLEEQGLISINNDVNKYLKNFQIENNYEEPIKIQYLLTHTDGFETRDLATFVQDPTNITSLENTLKSDLNSPVQKPGSMITYGGYGTALAGCLISEITNKPFEEYIDDNIFKPLDMKNSTFNQVLPENLKEKSATIYNYENDTNKFTPTQFLYVRTPPTGGLSTTTEDMGKFLIALLNKGEYGQNKILKEKTVEKMLDRQYSSHPSLPGVTYGFMESLYNGQRGLIRDGSGVGVRSQICLLPEYNLGYFYVQNIRGDEMAEEFNEAFLDLLFPHGDKKLDSQICTKELRRYEGNYRPSQTAEHTLVKMEALAIGNLKIEANEKGELIVTILGEDEVYGGFPDVSKWVEIEPLLFRRVDKERYMAFQENEKGEIISLTSGSGYHGSFVKIPWFESNTIQLSLLVFYITVFLATIIISIIKFVKGYRDKLQISGLISLLFITGIIGTLYALFFKRIAGFPTFAFGVSLLAKIMLTVLLLASFKSIIFLIIFIKCWVSSKMTLVEKVFYLIVMVSFMGIIFWLDYWNLLGYKY